MVNDFSTDLAIQLVGAARAVSDRLDETVRGAGVTGMRPAFGYVIRALAGQDRTLTELADLLDVTKQAAIKVVDEMAERGFLTREPHPTDRRVKVLRLTGKGMTVRQVALAASRRMEADLRAAAGDPDADAFLRVLMIFLEQHGVGEDAGAGRARALW
jgi:DNA-binding MarR family transcriptional regulator